MKESRVLQAFRCANCVRNLGPEVFIVRKAGQLMHEDHKTSPLALPGPPFRATKRAPVIRARHRKADAETRGSFGGWATKWQWFPSAAFHQIDQSSDLVCWRTSADRTFWGHLA